MAGSPDLSPECLRELQGFGGIAGHEGRHDGRTDDDPSANVLASPACSGVAIPTPTSSGRSCADGGPPPPPGRNRELVTATRHAVRATQ
jgi:hypothetical protein